MLAPEFNQRLSRGAEERGSVGARHPSTSPPQHSMAERSELPSKISTPNWVKEAIFYQIFPERFCNGDPSSDPANVQPWGTPPTPYNFMGGDLRGVIQRFDYLLDLGINAIYLNPIFQSSSNHKYNTYDYYQIDPRFGDLATFKELLNLAHSHGVRVILDGVFNHCGRGFFPFYDLLENGQHSPYKDWFYVKGLPLHAYQGKVNYGVWWNVRSLPKFNVANPATRRYLLDVACYWIQQGADGWRLDVPNEIADHDFWREFRQAVKAANPQAYIVGEIWYTLDATPWLQGDQFDGVMNYVLQQALVNFMAKEKIKVRAFDRRIRQLLAQHDPEINLAQLNLLGSHDTSRFLAESGGETGKLKLAYLFLMTYPGAPCIYYGDEVGLTGGPDPECRHCMPWDESQWNTPLRDFVKRLVAIRKANPALRIGSFEPVLADAARNIYAYQRQDESQAILVVINNNPAAQRAEMPLSGGSLRGAKAFADLLSGQEHAPVGGTLRLTVPGRAGAILAARY